MTYQQRGEEVREEEREKIYRVKVTYMHRSICKKIRVTLCFRSLTVVDYETSKIFKNLIGGEVIVIYY